MPSIVKPQTKIKVVPKEGELEITLIIEINVNGEVTALSADNAVVKKVDEKQDISPHIIPDFSSGFGLNFGKNKEE